MKKNSLILIMLLGLATFVSCNSDNNNDTPANLQDITPIVNNMTPGSWRVTYYVDHGGNETDHFTGYNFTFGSGNVLTATNGTNTYTGVWNVTNTNSNDDSPNDSVDFNILFTAPPDFEDISDDWDVITRTANKIEFIDVAGPSSETDYITFEKNI